MLSHDMPIIILLPISRRSRHFGNITSKIFYKNSAYKKKEKLFVKKYRFIFLYRMPCPFTQCANYYSTIKNILA